MVGAELRVMATVWTRSRVSGRASALTRVTVRVRAMARARTGARNRARTRAKVICSTGILSETGNMDGLKVKCPMACLVGKAGSRAGLPRKAVRGAVHENAGLRVAR